MGDEQCGNERQEEVSEQQQSMQIRAKDQLLFRLQKKGTQQCVHDPTCEHKIGSSSKTLPDTLEHATHSNQRGESKSTLLDPFNDSYTQEKRVLDNEPEETMVALSQHCAGLGSMAAATENEEEHRLPVNMTEEFSSVVPSNNGKEGSASFSSPSEKSSLCVQDNVEIPCPLLDMVFQWGQDAGSEPPELLLQFPGKLLANFGDSALQWGKGAFSAQQRLEIYQTLTARCFAAAAFCWLNPQTVDGTDLEEIMANKFSVETEEKHTGIMDAFKQIGLLFYGRLQVLKKKGDDAPLHEQERGRIGQTLMEWIYCAKHAAVHIQEESGHLDSEGWILTFLEGKLWGKFRNDHAGNMFRHVVAPLASVTDTVALKDEDLIAFDRALSCYLESFCTCGDEEEDETKHPNFKSALAHTSKRSTYHRLHATRLKLLYIAGILLSRNETLFIGECVGKTDVREVIRALWCLHIAYKHNSCEEESNSSTCIFDFLECIRHLESQIGKALNTDLEAKLGTRLSKLWDAYFLCYLDCLVAMQECLDADQHFHQAVYTLCDALHRGKLPTNRGHSLQAYLEELKGKYPGNVAARAQMFCINEDNRCFGEDSAKRCLLRLFSKRVATVVAIWMPQTTLEKWESLQQRQSKYDYFRRKYLLKYLELLDATSDWDRLFNLHKQLDSLTYRQATNMFNSEMQWYLSIAMVSVLQKVCKEGRSILEVSSGPVERSSLVNAEKCLQWAFQLRQEVVKCVFGKKCRQYGAEYSLNSWGKDANNRNAVSFPSLRKAAETLLVENFRSYNAIFRNSEQNIQGTENLELSPTCGLDGKIAVSDIDANILQEALDFCVQRWRSLGGHGRLKKAHQMNDNGKLLLQTTESQGSSISSPRSQLYRSNHPFPNEGIDVGSTEESTISSPDIAATQAQEDEPVLLCEGSDVT
jgi:hypothetical protein